jgi:hypothetical protein
MNVEESSGRKKRSGGAHRVQARPFEGPSQKQGFLFCKQKTRFGRQGTKSGFLIFSLQKPRPVATIKKFFHVIPV